MITADPNNPFQSIQTGEQQSRGFETDLFYQPTNSALSVLVNYAYTKAEITEDNAIPVGDQLRAIPKHKGRLALSYELGQLYSGAVNMGLGVTLTSSRELTLPNTTTAAGSAIWDLQSSWRSNDWTLGLSVVNLTGHKGYEPYQYFGGQYVIPVQPRSIYFRLRRSF